MEPWCRGALVQGALVLWSPGDRELWCHGALVPWLQPLPHAQLRDRVPQPPQDLRASKVLREQPQGTKDIIKGPSSTPLQQL